MDLALIDRLVAAAGLTLRGGFHPTAEDGLPLAPGGSAATLLLVGNVGPGMWQAFSTAPERDGRPHPLDAWTRRVVDELAAAVRAQALYAFTGPPYWPFQRWAMRAEPVTPSPLGILIHPEYGLWHAYRAALLFADRLELPPTEARPSPCASCALRPCLSACPVGAFTPAGYDVVCCVDHISGTAGAMCMEKGCRAREACPVGAKYRYSAAQEAFHMEAFLCRRSAGRPL
jgi:hypothetical protein